MKLLLDEMLTAAVARGLRSRGHDVDAVVERQDLRGLSDRELLAVASREKRAIVTENVRDFCVFGREIIQRGESHAGVILFSAYQFPRSDSRTIGQFVRSLETLLISQSDGTNLELWLR